jgi:hypothetical protein
MTRDIEQEEVRAALRAVAAAHNGVLNPHDVVDAARPGESVLHGYFEWDDAKAAEQYRLAQASALVRRVKLSIVRTDREQRTMTITTTRGYQSRPSMRSRVGGYEAIEALLSDAQKRAELLAHVLSELTAYRKRYADLSELESVWTAVDDAVTEYQTDSISSSAPDGESRPGAAG